MCLTILWGWRLKGDGVAFKIERLSFQSQTGARLGFGADPYYEAHCDVRVDIPIL